MKFTKMHGLGNDYIILDCMGGMPEEPEQLARRLSDRHFGVGSDGIICVCPSVVGDFGMRMFNADGTEGLMCGNGIRCLVKYVFDEGLTEKKRIDIETAAGVRTAELCVRDRKVTAVTIDMGAPIMGEMAKIYVSDRCFTGVDVSMGNPHFVILTPDVESLDVSEFGSAVERNPRFSSGVNVEFVHQSCRERIAVRVWERGSGETLACGTGACAAAAALYALGRIDRAVTVALPGGELEVVLRERDGHLLMTGPAVTVFEGEVE